MRRNEAGQHFNAQLNKLADGTNAIGLSGINITIEKDGGGESPGAGGVSETANGGYKYLFTQAETDAAHVVIAFGHSQAITQRFNIYTDDGTVTTELGKVIKSGELTRHVQGTINTNKDVEVTATRV